jgi:hypothetical protein
MPTATLTFAAVLGACQGLRDDERGSGGGGDTDEVPDADIAAIDVSACSAVPDARRYHHMAYLLLDTPIQVAATSSRPARVVERGFVLHGGVDASHADLYDDVWLFDIGHALPESTRSPEVPPDTDEDPEVPLPPPLQR